MLLIYKSIVCWSSIITIVLGKIKRFYLLFSLKITQLTRFLRDHRSQRSRQISSLTGEHERHQNTRKKFFLSSFLQSSQNCLYQLDHNPLGQQTKSSIQHFPNQLILSPVYSWMPRLQPRKLCGSNSLLNKFTSALGFMWLLSFGDQTKQKKLTKQTKQGEQRKWWEEKERL